MVKKNEPVEITLDSDVAIAEMANTLYIARERAILNNDVDALMNIAAAWFQISSMLGDKDQDQVDKLPVGFGFNRRKEEHEYSDDSED